MSKHPRGDVEVTIDSQTYLMKPTFNTISVIQSQTKLGLGELVKCLGLSDRSALRIDVVALVLFYGITASNKTALTLDEIGDAVVETLSDEGQPLITSTAAFLLAYFGKPKAGEEKKPGETAEA